MPRLILLSLVLLAGCWFGGPFYSPSETVTALPPGRYRAISPAEDEPEKVVRVSRRGDGMTRVDAPDDEPLTVGFVPLGTAGDAFVGWSDPAEGKRPGDSLQTFWLLFARDGEFRLYLPICEGVAAEIAAAAGASVERDVKVPGCRFADRASLEAALLRLAPRSDEMVRLIRLP